MVRFRIIPTTSTSSKKKLQDDVLPKLSTLLKQRRYDEICEILQFHSHLGEWLGISNSSGPAKLQQQTQAAVTTTSASILHQMIRSHAPLHVIDLLLTKLTELYRGECPATLTDAEGQTALHVAVIHGADIAVIRRLTAHSTLPASTMDVSRRFPLHWACAASSHHANSSTPHHANPSKASNSSAEVIRFLLELYPEALTVRDATGKTPLELTGVASSPSKKQRRRRNEVRGETVSTTARIQLELNTALWRLLPSCRSAVRKGQKGRTSARMRFVV